MRTLMKPLKVRVRVRIGCPKSAHGRIDGGQRVRTFPLLSRRQVGTRSTIVIAATAISVLLSFSRGSAIYRKN